MPVAPGRLPLSNAARDGLQTGAAQWALVKVTPSFARRSRLGVLVCTLRPKWPTQWFRSSTGKKRTLGCSAAVSDDVRMPMDNSGRSVRMDGSFMEWLLEVAGRLRRRVDRSAGAVV